MSQQKGSTHQYLMALVINTVPNFYDIIRMPVSLPRASFQRKISGEMGAHAQHHNDLPSTTAALHRRIGEASASMCTSCSGSSFCSTQVATHRPPHPPVTTTSHPLMPERIRYSWPTLWNALEFLNVNSDSELHYEICRSQTSNTNEGWVLNHRC